MLFTAIVVVFSLAAYALIDLLLKIFLKPLPESESDEKKTKDSKSKSKPKVSFRNPMNFFRKASRAFMSVINYLAKLSVRAAPELPAMTTNLSTVHVGKSLCLPARYKSGFFKAIDYDLYDSPTYIRKAEADLAAQREAALQRNKRKRKS